MAEAGGGPVGQVVLRAAPEPVPEWTATTGLPPHEVATVSRRLVAPEQQGRGLAQQLFHAAWAEARRLNRRAILEVQTDAPASTALHASEGWMRAAPLPAPWTGAEGRHPQVYVYVWPV